MFVRSVCRCSFANISLRIGVDEDHTRPDDIENKPQCTGYGGNFWITSHELSRSSDITGYVMITE